MDASRQVEAWQLEAPADPGHLLPAAAPPGLQQYLARRFPGERLAQVVPFATDPDASGASAKALGYGEPLRIVLQSGSGQRRDLVLHMARADDFGHDRRADRAGNQLLAFDTFRTIPRQVEALDVGAIVDGDILVSLAGSGEFYLLTSYAPGTLYADDLRRIARSGIAEALDLSRCDVLARYLAGLHARRGGPPARYRRCIRDLLGHGEGIFGIVDGFPDAVEGAPRERLRAIEERCLAWRWRLKDRVDHLTTTHGDFHPFNILFDVDTDLAVLDASRGGRGDAADDVTCLAINYIFFALDVPHAWPRGLGVLWRRLWRIYLQAGGDVGVLAAAAPYLAWRGLVLTNPAWYPQMSADSRKRLLAFVERALDAETFDPDWAEELFS